MYNYVIYTSHLFLTVSVGLEFMAKFMVLENVLL